MTEPAPDPATPLESDKWRRWAGVSVGGVALVLIVFVACLVDDWGREQSPMHTAMWVFLGSNPEGDASSYVLALQSLLLARGLLVGSLIGLIGGLVHAMGMLLLPGYMVVRIAEAKGQRRGWLGRIVDTVIPGKAKEAE